MDEDRGGLSVALSLREGLERKKEVDIMIHRLIVEFLLLQTRIHFPKRIPSV